MSWELLVLCKIGAGSVLAPIAFRLLGQAEPYQRLARVALQFGWAAFFAVVVVWGIWGGVALSPFTLSIILTGALMPVGTFFQWRVFALSPWRGGIFMSLMNAVPLLLSAVFLGEWQVFADKKMLLFGFSVTVLAIVLQCQRDIDAARKEQESKVLPPTFTLFGVAFVAIFGIGTFAHNYWAKMGVPISEVLVPWYTATFVGALALLALARGFSWFGPRLKEQSMPIRIHLLVVVAALSIFLTVLFQFAVFQRVEQAVVLPMFALGDIAGSLAVGVLFRDWEKVRGVGWLYLALGFAGAATMAVTR